jgi:hypothetical protein
MMKKRFLVLILFVLILVFTSISSYLYIQYQNLGADFNDLAEKYSDLTRKYDDLTSDYENLVENQSQLINDVFNTSQTNCTAVTVLYYTNFGTDQQIMPISIAYKTYEDYHNRFHPKWDERNLTSAEEYITNEDTIVNQIVESVRNQTTGEEELANALLDFVQYKNISLSMRYYPTTELKYPIETLVEMGGDCDAHSFLYATLMKAAGFDVLLLLSKEPIDGSLRHVATAVHLASPPTHSLPEYDDKVITLEEQEYYFAETTSWNYRVGDYPTPLQNVDFYIIEI